MKKHLLPLVLLFSAFSLSAQITIDDTDFANAFDTVRMSEAVWNPLLDFSATGTSHTWDFSELQWQSNYMDTFLSPLWVSPIYNFTYSNIPFNPYRANIGIRGEVTLTTFPFLNTIFTNAYNFYYKSQTLYIHKGYGMRVSGFPTSVPMTHPDTLYHFPMEYGNEDSCRSDYTTRIPNMGTFRHEQSRTNKVDGWGTLITPFGTFDALRHVSEIHGSDSLHIDTLNFGFKLNNDIIVEYKWFGKGFDEPLLQINTQKGILGQFQTFEFVTKVIYRDSVRFVISDVSDLAGNEIQFGVFPNPASEAFTVLCAENTAGYSLIVSDLNGRVVLQKQINQQAELISVSNWQSGIYFVMLQSGNRKSQRKLVVE